MTSAGILISHYRAEVGKTMYAQFLEHTCGVAGGVM